MILVAMLHDEEQIYTSLSIGHELISVMSFSSTLFILLPLLI